MEEEETLWGYKVGDRVIVNLQMIPFVRDQFPEGEHDAIVVEVSRIHGRVYLSSADWPRASGKRHETFWVDNSESLRFGELDKAVIESSKQDLASWIKELS